jgi:hypothetical protein
VLFHKIGEAVTGCNQAGRHFGSRTRVVLIKIVEEARDMTQGSGRPNNKQS